MSTSVRLVSVSGVRDFVAFACLVQNCFPGVRLKQDGCRVLFVVPEHLWGLTPSIEECFFRELLATGKIQGWSRRVYSDD